MSWQVVEADCLEAMAEMEEASVDAIVTDPPYNLGFMSKPWDIQHDHEPWAREALRVLKPGGHLLAFGGTRTFHRLTCAIEDAGFEIRDCLSWLYGSGFPKSLDVSKAIDKAAGAERQVVGRYESPEGTTGLRSAGLTGEIYGEGAGEGAGLADLTAPATPEAQQWNGWGTALKPAHEPIVLARKPLIGTVAQNCLEHGTGALNVDGCRVFTDWSERSDSWKRSGNSAKPEAGKIAAPPGNGIRTHPQGRWPANVVLDEEAAGLLDEQSGELKSGAGNKGNQTLGAQGYGSNVRRWDSATYDGNSGGASRFFPTFSADNPPWKYQAKASRRERNAGLEGFEKHRVTTLNAGVDGSLPRNRPNLPRANAHPTVKPVALMRWLCRLVTPPNGLILDPFCDSGTTGIAAVLEGFNFIGIEREPEYVEIARARIAHWSEQPRQLEIS